MKRILSLALTVVFVMVAFTGCIVIPRYRTFAIRADTVASVELYDLCGADTYYGYFIETETPVYEIPPEQTAAFLKGLSEIRFSNPLILILAPMDPSFYYDAWTVRVNYTDGTFELISSDGFGQRFDQNADQTDAHHYGCSQEEWDAFIGKYIPGDMQDHSGHAG